MSADGPEDPDLGLGFGLPMQAPPAARRTSLAMVFAVVVVVLRLMVGVYVIPSASMETTLHGCTGCTNDRVLVDKVGDHVTPLHTGDVIVFAGPPSWLADDATAESHDVISYAGDQILSVLGVTPPGGKDFVKRVIAVGGQTVECCNPRGNLIVDGVTLDEPYVHLPPGEQQGSFGPLKVPPGYLWVMGDNRNNSADARYFGPIPESSVIGRVRLVVWPPGRMGGLAG